MTMQRCREIIYTYKLDLYEHSEHKLCSESFYFFINHYLFLCGGVNWCGGTHFLTHMKSNLLFSAPSFTHVFSCFY